MSNKPNSQKTIAIGAFSMAIAIALGAYNAHGMEKLVESGTIDTKYLDTFHTGVLYQFINSLGLLLLGLLQFMNIIPSSRPSTLILAGTLVFSGTLYILSFHQILGSVFKILGAITPIGGLCMIIGWLWVGITILKEKHK